MPKQISQMEARRLKKRVRELESKLSDVTNAYGREYPGTYIATSLPSEAVAARLDTARKLGHVVIARLRPGEIHFFAAEKRA